MSLSSVYLNCALLLLKEMECAGMSWASFLMLVLCLWGGALVKARGQCWDVFLNHLATLFFGPESLASQELAILARLIDSPASVWDAPVFVTLHLLLANRHMAIPSLYVA